MAPLEVMSPPRIVFKSSVWDSTFMYPYITKAIRIFLKDFIQIDMCNKIFKQPFVF